MPALPLGEARKYVALAYVVLLMLLIVYIAIMNRKLHRAERRLSNLDKLFKERRQ